MTYRWFDDRSNKNSCRVGIDKLLMQIRILTIALTFMFGSAIASWSLWQIGVNKSSSDSKL